MKPIAVFYHCLFFMGDPPQLIQRAVDVVEEHMEKLYISELLSACDEFHVGMNGGVESVMLANTIFPDRARIRFHGLDSKSENATILMIEEWVKTHPDWYVFYFHSKTASHVQDNDHRTYSETWTRCMLFHLMLQWKRCCKDLENGFESVGCHWMDRYEFNPPQHFWGGNFWWAKSSFLKTVPPLASRDRIKESGIMSIESRYEAEVWIGNGNRLPIRKDYHPQGPDYCIKYE